MRPWIRDLLVLSVVFFSAVGCGESGPPLGTVSGKVTLDSKPLPNSLVTFVPQPQGRSSTGTTDADGNYKLIFLDKDGALVGKHKVVVTTIQTAAPVKEMSSDDPEYAKQAQGEGSATAAAFVEKIPAKYNAKSELIRDVTSGNNVINLELTSS